MFGLFKKKLDPQLLALAGASAMQKIQESLESGCSLYETNEGEIDDALRHVIEAQLCFLAVFRPTFSYAVEDVYFKAGKVGFSDPLPAQISFDDERGGLRQAISGFPTCKSNIDMRFRYMFVADVATQAEDSFWDEVVTICQPKVRRAFENKSRIDPFWVGVIASMGAGDGTNAWRLLREAQ